MNLFVIFSIGIFALFLSPNAIMAQPDPLENPDRPYMTDGLGNGVNPGDKKKTSNEIFEDFLDIFLKPPKNDDSNSGTNNSTGISPVLSPSIYITQPTNNGEIPSVPTNSDEKSFASIITSLIHQDCTSDGVGRVNKKNTTLSQTLFKKPSCITRVQGVMNTGGINEIHNSVNGYSNLQCVGCARAMAAARNRPLSAPGNAKDYIGKQLSNYTYIANTPNSENQLTPGSIGISNEGTYGHIFYISEVYRDTNGKVTHYLAWECNWGGPGYVRHDQKRSIKQLIKGTNTLYLAGWQKPN